MMRARAATSLSCSLSLRLLLALYLAHLSAAFVPLSLRPNALTLPGASSSQLLRKNRLCMTASNSAGKTLVVGATGRTGRMVVSLLAGEGVPVVALARDPSCEQAQALAKLPNVTLLQGDVLSEESLRAAVKGCACVVGTWGVTRWSRVSDLWTDPHLLPDHPASVVLRGTQNLVRACEAEGVRRIVKVSSFSSACAAWSVWALIPALLFSLAPMWERGAEQALRRSTKVGYTVVRPAVLKDAPRASEDSQKLVMVSGATGEEPGVRPLNRLPRADLAALCALLASGAQGGAVEGVTMRVARMTPPSADNNYWQEPTAEEDWEALLPSLLNDGEGMRESEETSRALDSQLRACALAAAAALAALLLSLLASLAYALGSALRLLLLPAPLSP